MIEIRNRNAFIFDAFKWQLLVAVVDESFLAVQLISPSWDKVLFLPLRRVGTMFLSIRIVAILI